MIERKQDSTVRRFHYEVRMALVLLLDCFLS